MGDFTKSKKIHGERILANSPASLHSLPKTNAKIDGPATNSTNNIGLKNNAELKTVLRISNLKSPPLLYVSDAF